MFKSRAGTGDQPPLSKKHFLGKGCSKKGFYRKRLHVVGKSFGVMKEGGCMVRKTDINCTVGGPVHAQVENGPIVLGNERQGRYI